MGKKVSSKNSTEAKKSSTKVTDKAINKNKNRTRQKAAQKCTFLDSLPKKESDSSEKNNFVKTEISRLVKEKRETLFNNDVRTSKKPKSSKILPVALKHKMDSFLSNLDSKDSSEYDKKLNDCIGMMHTPSKPHFNSPSVVLKAINDCILTRNWNNLTHLLLMFVKFKTATYNPLIRHLCQILAEFHPAAQGDDIQKQFRMVRDEHKKFQFRTDAK